MNIFSLPSKVRQALDPILQGDDPTAIVRANGSIDGSPGESYLVTVRNMLFVFSRTMGVYDYTSLALPFNEIGKLAIKKDQYDLFLELSAQGNTYSLKFSSYQEKDLTVVVDAWGGTTKQAPPPLPPATSAKAATLSPFEIAISALIFAAATDVDIDPSEEAYIKTLEADNTEAFRAALQYYETHTPEDVMALLSALDEQQKICVLANVMELCMADGVLDSSEQILISKYATSMGVSPQRSDTMRDVLLIKNQTSVLGK